MATTGRKQDVGQTKAYTKGKREGEHGSCGRLYQSEREEGFTGDRRTRGTRTRANTVPVPSGSPSIDDTQPRRHGHGRHDGYQSSPFSQRRSVTSMSARCPSPPPREAESCPVSTSDGRIAVLRRPAIGAYRRRSQQTFSFTVRGPHTIVPVSGRMGRHRPTTRDLERYSAPTARSPFWHRRV